MGPQVLAYLKGEGCLARFDLLDGIYFLSFAGSCLQGEVC